MTLLDQRYSCFDIPKLAAKGDDAATKSIDKDFRA
jgi:hypothetical protein